MSNSINNLRNFYILRSVCGKLYEKVYKPGSCDSVGCDVAIIKITCQGPVDSEFVNITQEQLKLAGKIFHFE